MRVKERISVPHFGGTDASFIHAGQKQDKMINILTI